VLASRPSAAFPRGVAALAGIMAGLSAAAAADVLAGDKVFNKCRQCHHIGEGAQNFSGPVLNRVVGRNAGTVPGYAYSKATMKSGIVWTVDVLKVSLRQPKAEVAGTNMTVPGLKDPVEIDDVIAYIGTFDADGKQH
jgi:cytochrome c